MIKKSLKFIVSGVMASGIFVSSIPVHASTNMNLSAIPNNEGDYISLKWNSPDNSTKYSYMIYSKKSTDNEYQSIPAKGTVKVLNVYPNEGRNLKKWMETPNDEDEHGYGKGLISVDDVFIDEFNQDPYKYLKDADGSWKYDVIFEGASDGNSGAVLSDYAVNVIKEFTSSGRGFLSGHDTYSFCAETNLVKDMSAGAYGSNSINISKKGLLTNYPWNIGNIGTNLSIPLSHVGFEYAFGDVWMKFNNDTFSGTPETNQYNGASCTNNFYLTTWNNYAMIQTGHSNGEATADEQKVLANTLFYLAQVTEETKWDDHKGQDIDAPTIPDIQTINVDKANNNVSFTFKPSTDQGTTYDYYIEATDLDAKGKLNSEVKQATIMSGLSGYYVVVDNNPDIQMVPEVTTTETSVTKSLEGLDPENFYVHVASVDKVGNVSAASTYKYGKPSLTLTPNTTQPTNEGVKINVNASSESAQIIKIIAPNGEEAASDSIEYTVTENGTYEFVAVDSNGLYTKEIIEVSNIVALPELNLTLDPSESTTGSVTIKALAASKDGQIIKIVKPDGTEVNSDIAEFTVSENGTYTFKTVDSNGMSKTESITVSNIKEVVFEAPELTLTANTLEETTEPVVIAVKAVGKDAQIVKIIAANGQEVASDYIEYTVTENGTYSFTAVDSNGMSTTKTITISNIGEKQAENKYILNIEPEKNSVRLQGALTAAVTIDNINDIVAEDIRIKYDSSKLKFLGMNKVDGIMIAKDFENEDELRVILLSEYEKDIVNGKKTLLKLNFQAIGKGDAVIDVVTGKVSDGISMEKDLLPEECGQATVTITDCKDVNGDGQFTLLDLAIDRRNYGKNPSSLPQYNTDIVENGAIDDDDLSQILDYMLENPNYKLR